MKLIFSFIVVCISLFAGEREEEVQIGKHTFILKQEIYNEYGDKGITLLVYAKAKQKEKLPLLSFVLENQSGSCTNKSLEKGTYEIKSNSIKFYSHWERYGKEYNAPIGNRIQVYHVDENGTFYQTESKVYIEKSKRGKEVDEGMKYLYTEAKTSNEKEALKQYIGSVEHIFEAKFVRGNDAKILAKEVTRALIQKQKQRWK